MARNSERGIRLFTNRLSEKLTEKLHGAAVEGAIGEFATNNKARLTAGIQSGVGLHAALAFASVASILGTIATAGVLAPLAATLVGLAAESSAIMTGTSAVLTAIGQARAKLHERRIPRLTAMRGFT